MFTPLFNQIMESLRLTESASDSSWGSVYAVGEVGGKWYIYPRELPVEVRGKGRPFQTRDQALDAIEREWPYLKKQRELRQNKLEREAVYKSKPRNQDVDSVADENHPRGSSDECLMPGDLLSRVVYGVRRGQDILPHELSEVGLAGDNPNVRGIHVGDPDYWRSRLNKDYGRRGGRAIVIRTVDGDRVVEDVQYMTDPDTGEKADSAVLLTSRKVLRYGVDWVFDGEEFVSPLGAPRSKCSERRVQPTLNESSSDSEYLAAVEAEDVEKCQQMVDDAAKSKGYNIGPVWHGTRASQPFNVFVSPCGNGPVFFTSKPEVAETYGKTRRYYLRLTSPMEWDAEGKSYWQVPMQALFDRVKQEGYDHVRVDNVIDTKGAQIPSQVFLVPARLGRTDGTLTADGRGLSSQQNWTPTTAIKSADPITYDDSKNPIPLSQRFNPYSNDIRY